MRRLLPIGLGILVSAVAIAILVATFDVQAVLEPLGRADIRWLVAAGGVIAAQVIVRTYRWRVLLPPRPDGTLIPAKRLLPVLLVGYLGNAVLPARLGEPIRAVLVDRRERVGLPEAFGSVLLERIVDLATLAALVLGASIVVGAPAWIVRVAAVPAVLGVGLVALLLTGRISWLVAQAARNPAVARRQFLGRVVAGLERLAGTMSGRNRRRAIGLAAALSAVAWVLEAGTFWLVAASIGIHLPLGSAMLIAGLAVLGTALPSAPGYIGTYDLAAALAAQALGVPEVSALALALLAHAVTVAPIALCGVLALVVMHLGLGTLAKDASAGLAARGPTDAGVPGGPEN